MKKPPKQCYDHLLNVQIMDSIIEIGSIICWRNSLECSFASENELQGLV